MQRYEMHHTRLRIIDEELGLYIEDVFDASQIVVKREDRDGSLYRLVTYLDTVLHGPSLYYGKEGILLSSSWFCRGVREGKTRMYYPNGRLYALEGFVQGQREGAHRYYDREGTLRTLLNYKKGALEGDMEIYSAEGSLKRKTSFSQGKIKELFHVS